MTDEQERAHLQPYAGVYVLAQVAETNPIPSNHDSVGHLVALCQLLDQSSQAVLAFELKEGTYWYYLDGQLKFASGKQVRINGLVDTDDSGIDGTIYLGYGGEADGLYFSARLEDAIVEDYELENARLVMAVDGAPPDLNELRSVREVTFFSQAAFREFEIASAPPPVKKWTKAMANTQLQKHSGDWERDTRSAGGYNEQITWKFYGDGTYTYYRSYVFSMDTYSAGDYNPSMMSSHTSEDKDAGVWKVALSGEQPVLVLDTQDGESKEYVLSSDENGVLHLGNAKYRWNTL